MRSRAYRTFKVLLLGLLASTCFVFSSLTVAHPHSWVEMNTRINGIDDVVTGFSMEWTFDAMTSAYMIDGEDMSPQNKERTLKSLAQSIVKNMLQDHYFTYFFDGDSPIRYKEVLDAELTQHRGKFTLSFNLPLAEPKTVIGNKLKLMIFEPSYYVDMSWKEVESLSLSPALQAHCQIKLIEPTPSSQQMAYALALPADADPDNALGQLFTQHAYLSCGE